MGGEKKQPGEDLSKDGGRRANHRSFSTRNSPWKFHSIKEIKPSNITYLLHLYEIYIEMQFRLHRGMSNGVHSVYPVSSFFFPSLFSICKHRISTSVMADNKHCDKNELHLERHPKVLLRVPSHNCFALASKLTALYISVYVSRIRTFYFPRT